MVCSVNEDAKMKALQCAQDGVPVNFPWFQDDLAVVLFVWVFKADMSCQSLRIYTVLTVGELGVLYFAVTEAS